MQLICFTLILKFLNIRMMIINIMKKVLNYDSDAKLCMQNKNDDIEKSNKTSKVD